jgi:glucokinase
VLLILVVIAAVVSVPCHVVLRKFMAAVASSAIASTVLVWVVASSHFGWLDQTFYGNLALSLGASGGVSVVVGALVRKRAKNN